MPDLSKKPYSGTIRKTLSHATTSAVYHDF
jgi:hypothetical protein